jgi:ankyrin repeat protein
MDVDQKMAGEMAAAILRDDGKRVRDLLAAGCDPYINVSGQPSVIRRPFALAASGCQLRACEVLLDHGVDPNFTESEFTAPLFDVVRSSGKNPSRDSVASLLLERGANSNLYLPKKGNGETPLHAALSSAYHETILPLLKILLRHGGDPHFIPPAPRDVYLTPFQQELGWFNNLDKLKFLMSECVTDPFQKTVRGRSMLQVAQGGFDVSKRKQLIKEAQVVWRSELAQRAVVAGVDSGVNTSGVRVHDAPVARPVSPAL